MNVKLRNDLNFLLPDDYKLCLLYFIRETMLRKTYIKGFIHSVYNYCLCMVLLKNIKHSIMDSRS